MKHSNHYIFIIFQLFELVYSNKLFPNMTSLDMKKEQMTCIDFDTLNQLKNLEEIKFADGDMSYFPDKDCNNPVHEEDTRALDLPNLKILFLMRIKLLKAPNTSLMPKLETFTIPSNTVKGVPANQFDNNGHLKIIEFFKNGLTSAPVITGGCKNLERLNNNVNSQTKIPHDYFNGCGIRVVGLKKNELTSFPTFAPLGNSVQEIKLESNEIPGMITNDMVKDLPNLTLFQIMDNKLDGFDASLCHGIHPITINVRQNTNLTIFENPYRFCIHLLDNFARKPKMTMTSTKIPCDHHRCWMKKYASKFTIQIDDCPDGRKWADVSEIDVCGQG